MASWQVVGECGEVNMVVGAPAEPESDQGQLTSIHSLPQEVLLHIFSNLSKRDLTHSVSGVSKEWQFLYKDTSLYRVLTLEGSKNTTGSFIKYVNLAQRLESLMLCNVPNHDVILNGLCKSSVDNNLRSLGLCSTFPSATNLSDSILMKVFEKFPCIETISFKGAYNPGDIFYENVSIKLPYLKVVHFIRMEELTHEKVMSFARNCPPLDELKIYRNRVNKHDRQITAEEAAVLCACVHTTIRVFYLDTQFQFEWQLDCFRMCQKLEDLKFLMILECGLTTFGSMPRLRHIQISWTCSPDWDWIHMCRSTALRNLESLCIHGKGFNDNVAVVIATNLKNLRKISLCLRGMVNLSYYGLVSIYEGCSELKLLILQWVGGYAYKSVLELPKYLPGLNKLSIFPELPDNRVDIEALKREMPNLIITHQFESA